MPQNEIVTVTRQWTLLTDADVTNVTLSNRGPDEVEIQGTNGATPPSATQGVAGILLERGVGIMNRPLTDLFPGVSSANRVYARIPFGHEMNGGACQVFVSHSASGV